MSSSLSCGRLATCTVGAVMLQILGVSLFTLGFFPVKPALTGVSGPESYRLPTCLRFVDHHYDNESLPPPDQLKSLYEEMSELPPIFDRLILMVVDGLPAEFVLGKGDRPPTKAIAEAMPYTQSLLSNRMAIGYHAKAAPPTVTMPRLKAMVSGAIGSFLDVAFNFNTQALLDDNLLGQFYKIGWKMVMLGDETWIKLFPGLFMRYDGVSSFYVKDTVEVDYNVTRHLEVELVTDDWNLLILHYLGLDHVGHIGGRNSMLMAPKLKEMDEVVKMIHMSTILAPSNSDKRTLLMLLSDHGMTNSGNHGGSSYEEMDSLALFIGLGSKVPEYVLATQHIAFQVDIAPTLSLLFGVPIPENSVGVLIAGVFDSLTDEQWLRALELNSWQLLRLLQAQLPGLPCGNSPCDGVGDEQGLIIGTCSGSTGQNFCCLYSKAVALHSSWTSQYNNSSELRSTVGAYYEFLRTSSEWLAHRATDKPLDLLASGISIMLMSCVILLGLLFQLYKETYLTQDQCIFEKNDSSYRWHIDETFALVGIVIHVLSLGASSMVEEEQYIWHFFTSTLYLIFLRMIVQSFPTGQASRLSNVLRGQKKGTIQSCKTSDKIESSIINYRSLLNHGSYFRICSIIVVLICRRILRGWHQGGVNWTHLPDISKWLERAGTIGIKSSQITSVLLVICLSSFALFLLRSRSILAFVVQTNICISGLLLLLHIVKYQSNISNYSATTVAQIIYATLGMTMMITVLASPWSMPVLKKETCSNTKPHSMTSLSLPMQTESLLLGVRDSAYLAGGTYTVCWCLLQLLLQQPINAVPILLLLIQILASMSYFANDESHHRQWVEVAAIYFLGMAGHFSLGNSNSLATIDVAGAFIGISSHSTLLAGILLFIITYASPMLFLLSLTMYIPMKDIKHLSASQNADLGCLLQMMIGFPCLLPLGLNSVILTSSSIILLLMRNHLFIWSVFSPKYLYVCAATMSVYIGVSIISATGVYSCSVIFFRTKMLGSKAYGRSRKL